MWISRKRHLSIVLAAILCCLAFACASRSQQAKSAHAPRIDFDKSRHNFGKQKEGVEVRHVFKVLNRGDAPLEIDKVITSCGCTVPTIKVKTVQPGKAEDLEVVMNTSLKVGSVTKEIQVFSNDPSRPKATIYVSVDVDDLHKKLTRAERTKLFLGKCAICHWQRGIGLEGEDLFKADCGMCHGDRAQGAVGPALAPRDYSNLAVFKHVTQVTSYGSKRRWTMPGFLIEAGGPLTEKEVASIVKYLSELSSKKKG